MWDLIVSVPDHCLSFYLDLVGHLLLTTAINKKHYIVANRVCVYNY